MRNLIFLLIAVSLFVGCERGAMENPAMRQAHSRGEGGGEGGVERFDVSLKYVPAYLEIINTKTERRVEQIIPLTLDKDTVLFIVNYRDKRGWDILSADKRTQPILASSEDGYFDTKIDNPGIATWLDMTACDILALKRSDHFDTTTTGYRQWTAVEQMIDAPENDKRAADPKYADLRKKAFEWYEKYGKTEGGAYASRALEIPPFGEPLPEPEPTIYWEVDRVITYDNYVISGRGPLIATKWGQKYPWTSCIPLAKNSYQHLDDPYDSHNGDPYIRCKVGCVAVAGAQMLRWAHYNLGTPVNSYATGSYTMIKHPYQDVFTDYTMSFSNPSSDVWDQMRLTKDSGHGDDTHLVSILMAHVGELVDIMYGPIESGANFKDLRNAFDAYGLYSKHKGYDADEVLDILRSYRPVPLCAYSERIPLYVFGIFISADYQNGHTWIADGFQTMTTCWTTVYREMVGFHLLDEFGNVTVVGWPTGNTKEHTRYGQQDTKLSMNWGEDGAGDNGLYVLLPGAGDWQGNFRYHKEMLVDIKQK